jgi:hypothetical protein
MAKQITFSYKGTDYTLEFTRRTVQDMEREGFLVEDVQTKPMSALPALFAGAFKAHHRFIRRDLIDEIYQWMPDKEKLIGKLAEMYNEPIMTLLNEPEEGDEKKVNWTASW